jgi:hypothetical protein
MRARSSLLCLVATLAVPAIAGAEPGQTRGLTVGLTALQPLSPWKDAGVGAAPWVGFTAPAWQSWNVTARAGWVGHLDKQQTVGSESIRYKSWELPVLVGVEYARPAPQGLLFSAELGYVLSRTRAEYRHEPDATATDHGAGLALGGGYRIDNFQVRVQLFMLGLPDPVKQKALMFGLQWTLPL